jgi:uncharacterized membrane protein YiaA
MVEIKIKIRHILLILAIVLFLATVFNLPESMILKLVLVVLLFGAIAVTLGLVEREW